MDKCPAEDIEANLLRYRNLKGSFKVLHSEQVVCKDLSIVFFNMMCF